MAASARRKRLKVDSSFIAVSRSILHCNPRRTSSVRGASRRRVADDDPLLEINHGLRDADGVVGDPFEVARRIHQLEPGVKLFGVLAQTGLELLAQRPVLRVDGGVAGDDVPGRGGFSAGQGLVTGAYLE